MNAEPSILLRGVQIVDTNGPGALVDVLVAGGKMEAMRPGLATPEGPVREVEASGCLLMPGLFDMNVHLREPGREDKEDLTSGSAAAVNGGVTGLLAMPNTDPAVDTGGMVQSVRDLAEAKACIPVLPAGCVTVGRAGRKLAAIGDMAKAGVRIITDDPSPVENPQVLRRAMEYARDFGLTVATHPTTPLLTQSGAMHEGEVSYSLGLPGIPAMAEEICIDRDIALARHTRCRLHIQHVSTRRGMDMVRRAKAEGVAVTCELTPHHLIFDETSVGDYDTRFKMDPPLRTRDDCEALLEALLDGTADVIVSDHAPHSNFEKLADFASAPFGVSALDTLLPVLHHHLVKTGHVNWGMLVERACVTPRRLLDLPVPVFAEGEILDAVLFDPTGKTEVSPEFLRSYGANNPFLGETLEGCVRMVLHGGRVLVDR